MQRRPKAKRLYLIPVLTKALDVLELLQAEGRPMVLEAVHKRVGAPKTTVYRILKTLVHRGYVGQTSDREYEYIARPKKLRFGFGGQSAEMPFSQAVSASLAAAAAATGIDLVVLDNCYDAATAVRNAESLIRERVDVIIEFQVEQQVAPIIADKIAAANIPLIAIDIPHPHSTYFGVDNYRVGYDAGSLLAEFAIGHWKGKVDWMIGLDLEEAGPMVQSRVTGAFEAVRTRMPNLPVESFMRIDGRGIEAASQKVVREFLERHPKDARILIAAANDTSALGAIAALRELGRERHAAVVGQDLLPRMEAEMQREGTPAIGSVSHEVREYGPRLIDLALALLRGEKVPPYNFIEHKIVARDQVGARANFASDTAARADGSPKRRTATAAER